MNHSTIFGVNSLLGRLASLIFALSTVFMVFFSTNAIHIWPSPWNRASILLACLVPGLLVVLISVREWMTWNGFKKHLLLPAIIILIGILNILFSEDRSVTITVMSLFLISGIGIFVISGSVFMDRRNQNMLLWTGWACFLILCAYGVFEYQTNKSILLLSNNPIPAGSLLILLSAAPLILLDSRQQWVRIGAVLTLIVGIVMIIMIGKRGTVIGLLAMVFFSGFALPCKKALSLILLAVIIFTGGYLMRDRLNPQLTRHYFNHSSTLIRSENYLFAGHIWIEKPFFGIGLHAPLEPHLVNYEPKIYRPTRKPDYPDYVKNTKTFENIVLLGFVEMGTLFSIAYIVLITIVLKKVLSYAKENPENQKRAVLLLMPLFGFFVHSMTFDSIIYPHLNWLSHAQLGLLYNLSPGTD